MEQSEHRKTIPGPCFIHDQGRYIQQFQTLNVYIKDITKEYMQNVLFQNTIESEVTKFYLMQQIAAREKNRFFKVKRCFLIFKEKSMR